MFDETMCYVDALNYKPQKYYKKTFDSFSLFDIHILFRDI
jgi:hypothetical protein